jgi:hypothetical protein
MKHFQLAFEHLVVLLEKGILFGEEALLHGELKAILVNDYIEFLDFDDFGTHLYS